MVVTPKAKDFIVEKGWDAQFGARPLKRAIQKYVEDALAEEIIKTKLTINDIITVDFDEKTSEIIIQILKSPAEPEKGCTCELIRKEKIKKNRLSKAVFFLQYFQNLYAFSLISLSAILLLASFTLTPETVVRMSMHLSRALMSGFPVNE